jgi:hypothetical protein
MATFLFSLIVEVNSKARTDLFKNAQAPQAKAPPKGGAFAELA